MAVPLRHCAFTRRPRAGGIVPRSRRGKTSDRTSGHRALSETLSCCPLLPLSSSLALFLLLFFRTLPIFDVINVWDARHVHGRTRGNNGKLASSYGEASDAKCIILFLVRFINVDTFLMADERQREKGRFTASKAYAWEIAREAKERS